uniref:Uncharacterized protein n=1 Tax=Arundo donax TaxID=35708 RepID=A0A0A9CTP3_ARUDO
MICLCNSRLCNPPVLMLNHCTCVCLALVMHVYGRFFAESSNVIQVELTFVNLLVHCIYSSSANTHCP